MSKVKMMGALSALAVASVMGGDTSCVELQAKSMELLSCPCDVATLTFSLEGETSVAAHTVNVAVVVDGSGSVIPANFEMEQDFAMDAVNAFAARHLFDNGGTASYVQYSSSLISSGMFNNTQDFNDFVYADTQSQGGTVTSTGIYEGTRLLGGGSAGPSFMIVITDGRSRSLNATTKAADAARLAGITVFAVGVGTGFGEAELLAIAGVEANKFEVADFKLLDAALASILSSSGGIVIPCPSTNVTLEIELVSNTQITFSTADLEEGPTEFSVILDVCSSAIGEGIVTSANYTDYEGNAPDLSVLTGLVVGGDYCAAPTPPPTPSPTPSPKKAHKKHPKHGKRPRKGPARHPRYLGCYMDDAQHRCLDGPMSHSSHMSVEMCADTCGPSKYFGTTSSSDCACGDSAPATTGGKKCVGDQGTCTGDGCMSVFTFDKQGPL